MRELCGIEEENRAAMQRHCPHNDAVPLSPREQRLDMKQQARQARAAEEQQARQRVQDVKKQRDLAYGRHQEKQAKGKNVAASRYEQRQAEKAAQLQADEMAREERENKMEMWRAKQVSA